MLRCLLTEFEKTTSWSMFLRALRATYMILASVGWKNHPGNSDETNCANVGRANRKLEILLQRDIKPGHNHAVEKGAASCAEVGTPSGKARKTPRESQ